MFLTHFQAHLPALRRTARRRRPLAGRPPAPRSGRLRYVVEQATVGLLTGASGVGKSALLKRFIHELPGPSISPSTCT